LLPRTRRTRAAFKLALRYCKENEEQIRADAYASSLYTSDCKKFWNKIKRESWNKVRKFATHVNGATGSVRIAEMWKIHFEHLYSSVSSQHDQISFRNRISLYASDSCLSVSMDDIMKVLRRLKNNKAAAPKSD